MRAEPAGRVIPFWDEEAQPERKEVPHSEKRVPGLRGHPVRGEKGGEKPPERREEGKGNLKPLDVVKCPSCRRHRPPPSPWVLTPPS